MRYDGIPTTGNKFDYSNVSINEEKNPIEKAIRGGVNIANGLIGKLLAAGTISDNSSGSSTAYRQ